jgi:hypothetical protein
MGLVKNCQLCNKQFTTRSIKSAVWEKHCYECHTHTKRATHISRTQRKQNNLEASLRDELKTLTKKVTDIDVLISAEVSNAMMNMTNNDIFERITASVNARLNRLENEIQENRKSMEVSTKQYLNNWRNSTEFKSMLELIKQAERSSDSKNIY